ncbi:unnamed protein product, partial [marine sediment metagenome]
LAEFALDPDFFNRRQFTLAKYISETIWICS